MRQKKTEDGGIRPEQIEALRTALARADAVVVGAGAGLSASAGYTYAGARFEKYFFDFAARYGFRDMYSGGFFRYPAPEEQWAFWSRNIYVNRYMRIPTPVYEELLALLEGRDYFVITTNVDHCFQRAGFDKKRLFYTQGDYDLWQCSEPCHAATYDNAGTVRRMVEAQGFSVAENGDLLLPEPGGLRMTVPAELLPRCPKCGKPMSMNLRSDDTFVEDEGWHRAAERYSDFLRTRRGRVLFLELGVGYNTPGIIKYPFWQMTGQNPEAAYACVNYGDAAAPREIAGRSICIDGNAAQVLRALREGGEV